MADVSHELGSLRFVVESPLSSKVAMFNSQVNQHKQSQLLNPFSTPDGRASPKPTFSKDEYGKPLAGSLTEARGQKANIHVMKEMIELCQIIHSEGYNVKDEPNMRVIPFGELFNIYNYISDKVVGILLRARKHKLVEFEGEMLFQRRDDDVPVFLLRPIQAIRQELEAKIDEIKRSTSPLPQSTSVLMDKSAHQQKLQEAGLAVPGGRTMKSRTPSPAAKRSLPPSKAATPEPKVIVTKPELTAVIPTATAAAPETVTPAVEAVEAVDAQKVEEIPKTVLTELTAAVASLVAELPAEKTLEAQQQQQQLDEIVAAEAQASIMQEQPKEIIEELSAVTTTTPVDDNNNKADADNSKIAAELPTIVIETNAAAATEVSSVPTEAAEATLENATTAATDSA